MPSETPSDAYRIFCPGWRSFFWLKLGSLIFTVLCFFMVIESDPETVRWGWYGVILFGVLPVGIWLSPITRMPSLTLTSQGIAVKGLLQTKRWRWSDVGVFSVDEHHIYAGAGVAFRQYFAVAYSDENHDLLDAAGISRQASCLDADVSINVTIICGDRKRKRAEEVVEKLNSFRERFGRPEIEVGAKNTQEAASALLVEKQQQFWIYLVLLVFAPLVVLGLFWLIEYLF